MLWLSLRYHPYKPVRRQELKAQDMPRRLQFCQWLLTLTEQQLMEFLVSDEANFQLCGHVNSQNIRRFGIYTKLDLVNILCSKICSP